MHTQDANQDIGHDQIHDADPDATLDRDAAFWLLGSLCSIYHIPYNPRLLAQRFPAPYSRLRLRTAARELGIHTTTAPTPQRWCQEMLPAVVYVSPAEPRIQEEPAAPQPMLVLQAKDDTLLVCQNGSASPEVIPCAGTVDRMEEELLVIRVEHQPAPVIPGFEAQAASFGFAWFIPQLLRHKRIWRDVLLASLFIQLIALAMPLFTQVIIDKVIVHHTHATLLTLGTALGLFTLFNSALGWLRQYLILHTGNRIDAALGSQVFQHLLQLPLQYFDRRPTGTLVARLQGVETIREFLTGAAVSLILDLPFLLIFLAIMFAYSWQLSLIAVAALSAICLISLLVAPRLRHKLNQQFMLGARNQAFLTEYLTGIATVKTLQMESSLEHRYSDLLANYLAAGFSSKQVGNSYHVASNTLEQIMTLAILICGALLVMRNEGFTIGMLVAFQMFASRMSQPLLRLVGLWQEFQQASIAVKRLGDILDAPVEKISLTSPRDASGQGNIDIIGLGFRHDRNQPWLYRNLNLSLHPGQLTVLMGPSGCGKSTLAKLLLGFHTPQEGRILLDGQDIRYFASNELRASLGVVPQETLLFSGTLYENLRMAHPDSDLESIVGACIEAGIHDHIQALPDGYQTVIGERGIGLSGGQLQRIAIARALLRKPRLLIFDEATSNLDQTTAEKFVDTINRLRGKTTILFITHHIPATLKIDHIYQLGDTGPAPATAPNPDGNPS